MFNKLKTRTSNYGGASSQRITEIASHFGRVYAEAMEKSITVSHGRGPEFRPSSFPICPVLAYMQMKEAAKAGYYASTMSTSGGFFTSVGTAAHENIQYFMGETGRIFGDWKCKNPKCKRHKLSKNVYDEDGNVIREGKLTRTNTVNNKCPSCKEPMEYIEKEINYNGLKGHIDCIYKMPSGAYWIADYKTTTKNNLKSSKLPKREHLMQLPTYCYVLEKKYGMEIEGFSLLYFSRDNPFEFKEHAEQWTSRWRKKVKELIADQKKIYTSAVQAFALGKPELAIKLKPCSCPDDYEKKMPAYEPCPMEDVCFQRKNLLAIMKPDYSSKQLEMHLLKIPNVQLYLPSPQ